MDLQKLLRQELTELQNLTEEGKDRNDNPVKIMEDKIRIALNVPQECWFPASHSLQGLIENISGQLDTLQNLSLSVKMISDEDVLRNASGGLALEGVYKTSNPQDLLAKREQLIEVPDSFSITGPQQSAIYGQKEFSSRKSQTVYQEVIEKLGLSFSDLVKAGSQGIGFGSTEEEIKLRETEEKSAHSNEETYICNTKYSYIPLASSIIEKNQVKLSSRALHALKDIEADIMHSKDSETVTSRIAKFYDRFGSHVNQGHIHFGGIFWWIASAAVLSSDDLSDIRRLTSEALNDFVSSEYNGLSQKSSSRGIASSPQLEGSSTGRSNEALMSQVELSISKTGGPADVDNHLQWKSHLVTSNRTWSVIDRGTTLIPVWEILIAAHKDDFKDVLKLRNILMEAYTNITKVNVEKVLEKDTFEAKRANILIQSVAHWSTSECSSHLTELQELKSRLLEKTGSHNIWIHICLSNEMLQNYLLEVAKVNSYSIDVRTLMCSLLEPHAFSVKKFPNRKKILEWINQTQKDANRVISAATRPQTNLLQTELTTSMDEDRKVSSKVEGKGLQLIKENTNRVIYVTEFSGLTSILECAKEEVLYCRNTLSSAEKLQSAKIEATQTITLSLNSLCKTWRDNDQDEAELLVLSIITVLGYSMETNTFDHVLNWKEINFLQTKLQHTYSMYSSLKDQCATRAQAYLLQTALTTSMDEDSKVPSKEKGKRLQLIKSHLQDKLSVAIQSAIENSHGDWQWLESALQAIVMGTQMNDRRAEPKDTVYKQANLLLKQVPSLSQIQITDEENTPENDTVCKKRDSFMNLLQKLGLIDSYPKKMSQANVLLIDTLSLSVNQPSSEKELSSHYLYKLTMLDNRARYMFIKHNTSSMDLEDAGATVDSDDFFDFGDNIFLDVSCTQTQIHPMDVHMAVFHCANDFLRQYIVKKLSTCQFAIPFLVPDPCTEEVEFPFWVLQYISKSWQSNTNSTADSPGKYKSRKMSCTAVPVVSFIRLGESNYNSKSQILNGVISKQRHSVFFHRHCKGSTKDSLLMNGVVEIAWYCPGGKEDDIFDDCVAFLNLHGNAAKHQKQLEFLQAVSTVNVLLLSEHPLDEAEKAISQKLSKSPVPLICMFSGKELIQRSKNPTKVRLAAKNRNHAEFTEELILSIRQCIGENKQTTNIDMCCQVAIQQQFKVNEVHKTYQEGYEQAQTLISLLKEESSSALKEKLLPLQGELWHEWCRKNKEQYRLQCKEKESIEQQLSEISANMEAIRESQLFKATPLNDFVRSFIECLSKPNSSQDIKLYTLQWLTIFLDDLTTDVLAELEVDYQSTWRKMREVPKDKEKASHVNQMQSKLNNISDKMAATTISLQHLMREVGQLYEASQTTPKAPGPTQKFSTILPKIGADMLVNGCPLELMDGDAAHVPLTWIEAVMNELVKILGDRKLFVLSILGLQSSGKSTLLNTMFGVQFSVSVGRCTRGAFMQLIPVDSSIRNKLGYDFVLIVDTEGLRSPELSTKLSVNHDNELATFIIAIGDITVINIMGENPAEMQDILQICVQAFLRMKQVKIAPSCIFVHQNVADASAGEKAMEGRRRLLQKLDNMATIAAKEESIDSINEFSDVIQFDIESQVFYFKNLLEGDPPMAPPNPSYSQNVQELKTKLLTIAEWKTERKFSSFSEFRLRVGDIWRALLQENFVFSFRNTVEMMVYTSLEEKYSAWSWELRKYALEMQSKLCNQIGSNLIQDVNVLKLMEHFDNQVYNQLQQDIEKYFKEDKHKETLITWRVNIDKRFRNLRTELIDGTVKKCKELITSKNNRSELDKRKTEYTAELTKQSKALASNLKAQRLDDKQVTKEFDKLWANWTAKVVKAHIPNECVNVKATVEAILQKIFENQPNVFQKIKGATGKFEFDKKKHVSQSLLRKMIPWGKPFTQAVKQLKQEVTHSVEKYVTAKETSKEDFDLCFIYEILKKIETTIAEFECSTGNLKFTKGFKADLSIHLCLKYVSRFQRMQETFKTSNHPLTYLESQRDKYLQAFRNYCKGANSVTIFVDFLCKHIKPEFLTAVNEKTSQHIAGEMKSNNPAFNSNRSNLENHILKHLATVEDFSSFAEYIDFPKRYFERFIQEKTDNFCSDTGKLHMMHEENLGTLKNLILSTSTGATREVEDKKGNASMWLDCFCKTLGEHMVINRNDLHTIENEDIEDWNFFKDVMAKSLDEILKDEKATDMETLRKKPTEYLFNQLQGCWAQCPFCKAICTNTIPNHDGEHSVTFHRCDALAGWHHKGTDNFSVNFCTTSVSSDQQFIPRWNENESIPYKTYRKAGDPYNKWNITPDGSVQRYWKWFICQFQEQLENKYKYKFVGYGAIPNEWKTFTKESALEELV